MQKKLYVEEISAQADLQIWVITGLTVDTEVVECSFELLHKAMQKASHWKKWLENVLTGITWEQSVRLLDYMVKFYLLVNLVFF